MFNPQWLELPISRTNFHGPKDVRDIEVLLYFDTGAINWKRITNILAINFGLMPMYPTSARWVTKCVDLDLTPHCSNLYVYCLVRPVFPILKAKTINVSYDISNYQFLLSGWKIPGSFEIHKPLAKNLIRPREFIDWSMSLLGAQVMR